MSLLNKLSIGTAQFGLSYGVNNKAGQLPIDEVSKILEYAKKNNISYKVIEPKKKEFVIKSYADNFLKN